MKSKVCKSIVFLALLSALAISAIACEAAATPTPAPTPVRFAPVAVPTTVPLPPGETVKPTPALVNPKFTNFLTVGFDGPVNIKTGRQSSAMTILTVGGKQWDIWSTYTLSRQKQGTLVARDTFEVTDKISLTGFVTPSSDNLIAIGSNSINFGFEIEPPADGTTKWSASPLYISIYSTGATGFPLADYYLSLKPESSLQKKELRNLAIQILALCLGAGAPNIPANLDP